MAEVGMSKREQIARAINPKLWQSFDDRAARKEWTPEERAEEMAEALVRPGSPFQASLDTADAVLAVLREPDEGMLEAGRYGINGEPDSHADTEEAARDCWQAMIAHISKPDEPAGDG